MDQTWVTRTLRAFGRRRGTAQVTDAAAAEPLAHLGNVAFGPGDRAVEGVCHVCGARSTTVMLTAVLGDVESPMLSCTCGTWFFAGATAPDYADVEAEEAFRLRLDQAESIDAGAQGLMLCSALNDHAVVDIGCGIGLTSDLARWAGRPVAAFDVSTAARLSVERLGMPIHLELATPDVVDVPGPRLVYASEVLEHVDDPRSFLGTMRAIAGDDGYVIVTTPSVSALVPDAPLDRLLAVLAVGQHLFLCSPESLRWLLAESGFAWADVRDDAGRLFAVAGPRPVAIDGSFSRASYLEYLRDRFGASTPDSSTRNRLFGSRLFKEYVHAGRYAEAGAVLAELQTEYAALGVDLRDPAAVVRRYESASGPAHRLPDPTTLPFNTPVLCFLMGTLAIAVDHDRAKARRYFDAAIALADVYRHVAATGMLQVLDLEVQSVRTWSRDSIALHQL